eukprot:2741345-Rhodomonas_salina.3
MLQRAVPVCYPPMRGPARCPLLTYRRVQLSAYARCYAVCGTDLAYGATRVAASLRPLQVSPLCALAMRCAVLSYGMVLRTWYAMCSTGIGYAMCGTDMMAYGMCDVLYWLGRCPSALAHVRY